MMAAELQGQMTPKLVDGLYIEAMVLADEARSYFDTLGRDDRLSLDPIDRVGFSCESLKVTTRLMHVIAWLLTQRAVAPASSAGPGGRSGGGEAPQTDRALSAPAAAAGLVRPARIVRSGQPHRPAISPTSRREPGEEPASGCSARSEAHRPREVLGHFPKCRG